MSSGRAFIGSVNVGETCVITGVIKDYAGTAFQPTTLNFSLYDKRTSAVINSRDNVSLTPVSDYVNASGNLTHSLTTADNGIVNDRRRVETHVIRYVATWSSGTQTMIKEGEIDVVNLANPV